MTSRTMTREQFETAYAERSKTTVERLHERGRYAIPCGCDEEICDGWQMLHTANLDNDNIRMAGAWSERHFRGLLAEAFHRKGCATTHRAGEEGYPCGYALAAYDEILEGADMVDPMLMRGDGWIRCCVCGRRHEAPYPDLVVDLDGEKWDACVGDCAVKADIPHDEPHNEQEMRA